MGFNLFQAISHGVKTIRSARDDHSLKDTRQRKLGNIVCSASASDKGEPFDAFPRAGRWGKTVIEIPFTGSEITQCPHRHAIGRTHTSSSSLAIQRT